MKKYDYIIAGSGLFGAVFAHEAVKKGKKVLVLERRGHIGGNIYTEKVEGIDVHKYGAHIFHTSNKRIWDYVTSLVEFNNFVNSPVANYKGEMYNMPFNMNTFSKMFGRDCSELPAFIIKRLPVRFTYDNNYFNDRYQGIPCGGYTELIEKLLDGAEVRLNTDFLADRENYLQMADKCIYTGPIDEYFAYSLGKLEYRSLKFETELLDEENHQGVAVVNYTEREVPYTRVIEHKHFNFGTQPKTVVTREYPADWKEGMEPYYPVNNEKNNELYKKYAALAEKENVLFGGRLAQYKYFDMDDTVEEALLLADNLL